MPGTLIELAPHLSDYTSNQLWEGGQKLLCPRLRVFRESRLWVTWHKNPCRHCPPHMAKCHRYKQKGLPDRTVVL